MLEALKGSEKHGNKENEFKEVVVANDQMLSTISDMQKSFSIERTEIKNQLLDLQSKNQKLVKENREFKSNESELKTSVETLNSQDDERLKDKNATLISTYESDQKKTEVKYKRQLGK